MDKPTNSRLDAPLCTLQPEISYGSDGRVYWVIHKCCVSAVVTHVSWVICDVGFDGNIDFYARLKLRSRAGQRHVKKVKSPNTQFSFLNMPILSTFASKCSKCDLYWGRTIRNVKNHISKNVNNFFLTLLRNPCHQVKFPFTVRYDGYWINLC